GEPWVPPWRVPETRFGVLARMWAGSFGDHLLLLLAVSTSPRADGAAWPVTPRTRSRYSFCVTSSPCFAGRWGGQAAARLIGCSWPRCLGCFRVSGGAACSCSRRPFVAGTGRCSRAGGRICLVDLAADWH